MDRWENAVGEDLFSACGMVVRVLVPLLEERRFGCWGGQSGSGDRGGVLPSRREWWQQRDVAACVGVAMGEEVGDFVGVDVGEEVGASRGKFCPNTARFSVGAGIEK